MPRTSIRLHVFANSASGRAREKIPTVLGRCGLTEEDKSIHKTLGGVLVPVTGGRRFESSIRPKSASRWVRELIFFP